MTCVHAHECKCHPIADVKSNNNSHQTHWMTSLNHPMNQFSIQIGFLITFQQREWMLIHISPLSQINWWSLIASWIMFHCFIILFWGFFGSFMYLFSLFFFAFLFFSVSFGTQWLGMRTPRVWRGDHFAHAMWHCGCLAALHPCGSKYKSHKPPIRYLIFR